MTSRDPDIQREWQRLFDRFLRRLLELEPRSVLDVGCGRGLLVHELTQRSIPATGVDTSAPGDDPQIIRADAAKLPFDDNSFDWVTLRHVPHHLPNVPAALHECARVARAGLLIAEPWFDLDDPIQRVSERWDRWWKRQHERAGDVHRPCIPLNELIAALPGEFEIEYEHYRHVAHISAHAIDVLSQPLLNALPESHSDRTEYAGIAAEIADRGFTYNGTLILTASQTA
ncbi:MAG: class I SAM-dependent methyltransferase [Planctomycetes bacterium]|nr:class I SAM-dependent methyltransferase [Planctomycetota bacterium]